MKLGFVFTLIGLVLLTGYVFTLKYFGLLTETVGTYLPVGILAACGGLIAVIFFIAVKPVETHARNKPGDGGCLRKQ